VEDCSVQCGSSSTSPCEAIEVNCGDGLCDLVCDGTVACDGGVLNCGSADSSVSCDVTNADMTVNRVATHGAPWHAKSTLSKPNRGGVDVNVSIDLKVVTEARAESSRSMVTFVKTSLAQQASPEHRRQLWRVRLSYFPLVEGGNEDEDWAHYRDYYDDPRNTAVVLFDDEQAVGSQLLLREDIVVDGRRVRLMRPEYSYVARGYRGHAGFYTAGFTTLLRHRLSARAPTYVTGLGFPNSYSSLRTLSPRVWSLRSPDIPAFEREILSSWAVRHMGENFDDERGIVWHREHLPPPRPPVEKMSTERQELLREYEALNPWWTEGATLPVIAPVSLATFPKLLGRALRRSMKVRG
jgi:hypothetical protein